MTMCSYERKECRVTLQFLEWGIGIKVTLFKQVTKEIGQYWRGKLMNFVLDFLKSDTWMTYGIYHQAVEYINVRKVKCKELLNEVQKLQEQFQCSSVSGDGYSSKWMEAGKTEQHWGVNREG